MRHLRFQTWSPGVPPDQRRLHHDRPVPRVERLVLRVRRRLLLRLLLVLVLLQASDRERSGGRLRRRRLEVVLLHLRVSEGLLVC